MITCIGYLVDVGIEFVSSCKHRRFKQASKWFRLFFLLPRDMIIEGLNIFSESRVQCPLCGWQGHRFFHSYPGSGGVIRDNAICPQCRSWERQRAMAGFLRGMNLAKDGPVAVLYIAPHPALQNMLSLIPSVRVITVDLQSSFATIKMDLHQLGFQDESFGLVICSHVLEHVRDDIQCIRELHRVLRPERVALLPVPLNHTLDVTVEWGAPDPDQHRHVREYGGDYVSRLERVGFQLLPQGESVMAVRRSL